MLFALPEKRSPVWLHLLAIVFVATLIVLLLSRGILGMPTTTQTLFMFAGLSTVAALLTSTGYFGAAIFSLFAIAGDITSAISLFWGIFINQSNWSESQSYTNIGIIMGIFLTVGLLAQILVWVYQKRKAKTIPTPPLVDLQTPVIPPVTQQ